MNESRLNRSWQKLKNNRAIFGYMVFWIYNLTFLGFMGLGFGPIVLPSVIQGVRSGMIPTFYVIFGAILISIPLIAVILGLTVLRKHVDKLFLLGYGVQGPLMLILGVRFFGLGQTTLPVKIVMIVATIGLLTLLWHILDPRAEERTGALGYAKAIGLACLISIGLYASIWILFYALPFGKIFIEGIIDFIRRIPEFWTYMWQDFLDALRDGVFFIFYIVLGGLLFIFTGTLFVLLPIVVPWLYAQTWWRGNRGIGHMPAFAILVAVFMVIGLSLFATDKQPQAKAFALLETNPTNPADAMALLDQSDEIRAGLLNSYLARTRYLSALNELDHIRWIYEDAYNVSFDRGLAIQQRYEVIARPFLYHPVEPLDPPRSQNQRWNQGSRLIDEPEHAAELYEKFFDEPINEGEKEAVVRAVRTTWDPNRAQTAWQAVDDREVWLKEQNLTHTNLNHGIHSFELHEVYSNQTAIRQEVVYYFSLPESAVVTGVWLGDENGKQFAYQVAPRGAAQQVYQEQVRRRIDPALVEQIGPRQYRLRVFPIDPQNQRWENDEFTPTIEPGEDMHMWLTWQVLEQNGQIPLPSLSVLRNVYWNEDSVRSYPDQLTANPDLWLPTSLPAAAPQMVDHAVSFPNGQIVTAQSSNAFAPLLPDGLNLAVVLDRSFSMGENSAAVTEALVELAERSPQADLFLTSSDFRGEEPYKKKLSQLSDNDLVYFGGQNSAEIMQQFNRLADSTQYDAIIVLSDDGTFSTTANEVETVAVPDAPVWMVHLGGVLPNGYDDNTLEIVQASGGGAAGSLDEALSRLAVFLEADGTDIVDGYRWEIIPSRGQLVLPDSYVTHSTADPFAKIAARQLILAEMRANSGSITDVDLLDQLHDIAVEQEIITPFSSMIVLVNEAQQNRLDELSDQDDRFDREVEEVGETAPGPTVTGVPEPEEWLLMILAVGMLLWAFWKKRSNRPVGQLSRL